MYYSINKSKCYLIFRIKTFVFSDFTYKRNCSPKMVGSGDWHPPWPLSVYGPDDDDDDDDDELFLWYG